MFMPHPGLNRWVAGRGPCAQALPPHLDQDAAPASRAPTRPRKPPEFPTGQEPPQCPAELGARKHQEDANPEPVSRWKHARTCGPCTVLRAQPRAPLCPGREPGSTGSDRLLPPPPGRRRLRSHGEQGTRLGRRHRRRRCAALVVGPGFHRAGGKPRAADGAECPIPRVLGGRAATTPASAWPMEPPDHPTAELDAALLSQGLREKVGLSCSPVTPPGPGARGPGPLWVGPFRRVSRARASSMPPLPTLGLWSLRRAGRQPWPCCPLFARPHARSEGCWLQGPGPVSEVSRV